MNKYTVFFLLFSLLCFQLQAKTKNFGCWIEGEISKDIFKKLEFSIKPEVRLQDDFSVDEYLVDGQFTYKPAKFLRFAAAYRFNTEVKKSSNKIYHRLAFDAIAKKGWKRLEGSFRVRLTNYAEPDSDGPKNNYLRYRVKFGYDLRKCKFSPFARFELFHELSEGEITKNRFDIGATYKLSGKSRVGAYYRLQSYFNDKHPVHIVALQYKFSL